jgi:outer membrane protein assembly factor BamB
MESDLTTERTPRRDPGRGPTAGILRWGTPRCFALVCAVGLLLFDVAAEQQSADWPQFRGPLRDGTSAETGLLQQWPASGPRELWRVPLGGGFSGLSVSAGRIFTMFGKGGSEYVVSLDADTGKELWRVKTDANFKDMFGNGPRSTPTVTEAIVYALSGRGRLFAFSTEDGRELWSRDLREDYGASTPRWGFSTSPLIEGELLLVDVGGQGGGSIVAFHRRNGKEVWRSANDKAGYSSPIAIDVGELRQVLFFTGRNLVSVSPSDGRVYWQVPWTTSHDVNAATPVFIAPDRVFVSSGYDVGGAVLRITAADGKAAVQEVWRNREMKNKFSSSVLHGVHLYGFDEGTLKCVDVTDGSTRWRQRGFGHGSLIYADGHLIVLGNKGQLALVEATPEAFREESRANIFDGKTWTSPALSGGRLFLRDEKQVVALELRIDEGREN